MTPLETMAKARWEAQAKRLFFLEVAGTNGGWEVLGPGAQKGAIADMRAALLALTECAWPNDVSRLGRETLLTYGNTLDDASRAMLREIAKQP